MIQGPGNTLRELKNSNAPMSLSLLEKKKNLALRARMIDSIRHYFIRNEYLEVETPNRIPVVIPEPYIDAMASGAWFLHPSPEVSMKRLLVAGYEKIFQICKCYRDGERSSRHLPEFTLLEWYCTGVDYFFLMRQCEELIINVATDMGCADELHYQGHTISLRHQWERLSVAEALDRYAGTTLDAVLHRDSLDATMTFSVEPLLGIAQPTFLYDYPDTTRVLAKVTERDPSLVERFELFIGGIEIANGYTELTGIEEHRQRFHDVIAYRHNAGKRVYPIPEKFLAEMERMPASGGVALGVDRLAMIFTDSDSIDKVVAFTPEML